MDEETSVKKNRRTSDLISDLPDSLLGQILSDLSEGIVDLDSHDFLEAEDNFVSFVDMFIGCENELHSNRFKFIHEFKIEAGPCEGCINDGIDYALAIDAPKLKCMTLIDHRSDNFIIHNIGPKSASIVSDMTISAKTVEVICVYCKMEQLPQFTNLACLHAYFQDTLCEMLPTFLQSCPNLHCVVLVRLISSCSHSNHTEICDKENSNLSRHGTEFVHLKTRYFANAQKELPKTSSKMKLAKYFIANCACLKKLTLSATFCNIIDEIKLFPRSSTRCQIVMA
ncbi:hypothetical protein F2Q69_00063223 [Brassica cretica]|uniref:FBD domain-containing protein n=1 Tax=Brassica cretica TaxID=69181 RepID=A0A8S9RCC3_BRACR|nr:hypothetical protein F2Q69_00063223 [Brassica cretica]